MLIALLLSSSPISFHVPMWTPGHAEGQVAQVDFVPQLYVPELHSWSL